MPLDVNIDDNNTTLIRYQGTWTYRVGSTRQWEAGVHTTGQAGASATFNFRGYRVWVLGTIPAGSGTNAITVSIDGNTSGTITRTSNGSANYDEVYFAASSLRDTSHTIVVTNRGSTDSGYSEFMLDRFEFQTDDEVPTFPAFTSATSVSSSTSSISTRTSSYVSHLSSSASSASLSSSSRFSSSSAILLTSFMPFLSSTLVGSPTSTSTSLPRGSSSNSKISLGGVIGGIVSGLLVVIAILLFVFWRKRRSSKLSEDSPSAPSPSPFPDASERPTFDTNRRLLPTLLAEKRSYQLLRQQHQLGVGPTNAPIIPTLPRPSVAANGPSALQTTPAVEPANYDVPPPSYQQNPPIS